MFAVEGGNSDVALKLLEAGANANAKTTYVSTIYVHLPLSLYTSYKAGNSGNSVGNMR